MSRIRFLAAAIAASFLVGSFGAEAQTFRDRNPSRAPLTTGSVNQLSAWRPGTSYSATPGYRGTITATTPNRWGNFGEPSTGGGGGSP